MIIKVDSKEDYERFLGHPSKFSEAGLNVLLFHMDPDSREEIVIYAPKLNSFEDRWKEYKNIREMVHDVITDQEEADTLCLRSNTYIIGQMVELGIEFCMGTPEGVVMRCIENINH